MPNIRIFQHDVTSHFNSLLFFLFSHYIRQSQGIPPVISQDFYFPLTAHSVALPSLPTGLHIKGAVDRHSVRQEKVKKEAPVEVFPEVEQSESTHLPVSCSLKTSVILTKVTGNCENFKKNLFQIAQMKGADGYISIKYFEPAGEGIKGVSHSITLTWLLNFNLYFAQFLQQSMSSTNTLWQRRQSIARFPSQRTVRKSSYTEQAKLPLLNINHYPRVGQ